MSEEPLVARIADGVATFSEAEWNACAGSADPFASHAFLAALEHSRSVGGDSGWRPLPVAIDGPDGRPLAVMPAYLKSHSLGEYVFDHGWAEAFQRVGGAYYPKLQIAIPFTPVPGRRLLARDPAFAPALIVAAERIVDLHHLSSAHATFIAEDEVALFEKAGWLIRVDSQYHWLNRGYASFDQFLADLSSRKRKSIRKERAGASQGLRISRLSGSEIDETHWDAFWRFYQDTGARKWGHPYLTRAFFSELGRTMGDRLLLVFAYRGDQPVAGALNLVGEEALFGRYWGAIAEIPYLHFEICYYQAIEAAIERGLKRVEAGAQGAHKIARGYRPVATWSAHYIPDPHFREAVARFLASERGAAEQEMTELDSLTPFRKM